MDLVRIKKLRNTRDRNWFSGFLLLWMRSHGEIRAFTEYRMYTFLVYVTFPSRHGAVFFCNNSESINLSAVYSDNNDENA